MGRPSSFPHNPSSPTPAPPFPKFPNSATPTRDSHGRRVGDVGRVNPHGGGGGGDVDHGRRQACRQRPGLGAQLARPVRPSARGDPRRVRLRIRRQPGRSAPRGRRRLVKFSPSARCVRFGPHSDLGFNSSILGTSVII